MSDNREDDYVSPTTRNFGRGRDVDDSRESGRSSFFKAPFGNSDEDAGLDARESQKEKDQGRGRNDSTTLGATLSSQKLDIDWQAAQETLKETVETGIKQFTKAFEKSSDIRDEEQWRYDADSGERRPSKSESAFAKRLRDEKTDIDVLKEESGEGLSSAKQTFSNKLREVRESRENNN